MLWTLLRESVSINCVCVCTVKPPKRDHPNKGHLYSGHLVLPHTNTIVCIHLVKVLVVFYGEGEFEALAVSSNVTAEEVVNDTDIQTQLDKTGINNRFDTSCTSLS